MFANQAETDTVRDKGVYREIKLNIRSHYHAQIYKPCTTDY